MFAFNVAFDQIAKKLIILTIPTKFKTFRVDKTDTFQMGESFTKSSLK